MFNEIRYEAELRRMDSAPGNTMSAGDESDPGSATVGSVPPGDNGIVLMWESLPVIRQPHTLSYTLKASKEII